MSKWLKYDIKRIPPDELDIGFKRFTGVKMHILELFDYDSLQVQDFFKNCIDELDIINRVLTGVKYPFTASGKPTDYHYYQAFKKFAWLCHKMFVNNEDYWQKASESAWLGVGDCEDSTILLHTGFVRRGVDCFACFGVVIIDDKYVFGHAWEVGRLAGKYRLVETTLEESVPSVTVFPDVDINEVLWKFYRITYYPYFMIHRLTELWINSEVVERMGLSTVNVGGMVKKLILTLSEMKKKVKKKYLKQIKEIWKELTQKGR